MTDGFTADDPSETVDHLILRATRCLVLAGIPQRVARAEAEDLLSWSLGEKGNSEIDLSTIRLWEVLGKSLAVQIGQADAQAACALFASSIGRRSQREPLQWIDGIAPFRSLRLVVGPGVFIPRPETELVAGRGIALLRPLLAADHKKGASAPVVADLFAGSGAIGLSLTTELHGLRVVAVEKSPVAFAYLQRNRAREAIRYPWLERCYAPVLGNVFSSADAIRNKARDLGSPTGLLDAVIANPPYIPENRPVVQPEAAADPPEALYGGSADGLSIPARTIHLASQLLKPGGFIVMEHDPSQGQALEVELKQSGFVSVQHGRDLSGRLRWVEGTLKPAMKPECHEEKEHGSFDDRPRK